MYNPKDFILEVEERTLRRKILFLLLMGMTTVWFPLLAEG